MKHKTGELTGALLDAAVAMADGRAVWFRLESGVSVPYIDADRYDRWWPSQHWAQGGPIIERERIAVYDGGFAQEGGPWRALVGELDYVRFDGPSHDEGYGPTPLIAAMRAYVASKLGDEVEL